MITRLLLIYIFCGLTAQGSETQLRSFLQKYCYSCHDNEVQKADFNIEKMFSEKPFVRNLKKWQHIIELIDQKDMPPRNKKTQPSVNERLKFISNIKHSLESFDYSKVQNPGTEFARRLTNLEYENTVNDLLATKLKLADRLTPDLKAEHSFSNNSRTLFIQTSVLEKFYATAEYAVLNAGNFLESINTKKDIYKFAEKAYRRPLSTEDIQLLDRVYGTKSSVSKLQNVILFILASPKFLLKAPKYQMNDEVNQYEMASRLSYFLWGTLPDNQLIVLAEEGKLRNNSVLRQQVSRMLKSSKSIYLGKALGAEWLKFDQVGVRNRPDPLDNPFMTDSLYEAMKKESIFFYTYLHKANRPIKELISAKYTFLNQELARFYRIGGIKGTHIRPVNLKTQNRGGVLSQASILMVTSHPDRASPILRGNWVLSELLGTPPPPPPANVGEINDDEDIPFEKRLKQHSSKKECASCHQKIDPLGMSLKNFDQVGRWHNRRISNAKLKDGTTLSGLKDLEAYLIGKKFNTLKRNIVEKTLSFALGRQLYYYDEPAVRKILQKLDSPDAGFQDLLIATVQSYPFKFNRKTQEY